MHRGNHQMRRGVTTSMNSYVNAWAVLEPQFDPTFVVVTKKKKS